MTVFKCDICGKEMPWQLKYPPYLIKCETMAEKPGSESKALGRYEKKVDLCLGCQEKVYDFIFCSKEKAD